MWAARALDCPSLPHTVARKPLLQHEAAPLPCRCRYCEMLCTSNAIMNVVQCSEAVQPGPFCRRSMCVLHTNVCTSPPEMRRRRGQAVRQNAALSSQRPAVQRHQRRRQLCTAAAPQDTAVHADAEPGWQLTHLHRWKAEYLLFFQSQARAHLRLAHIGSASTRARVSVIGSPASGMSQQRRTRRRRWSGKCGRRSQHRAVRLQEPPRPAAAAMATERRPSSSRRRSRQSDSRGAASRCCRPPKPTLSTSPSVNGRWVREPAVRRGTVGH